MPIKRIYITIEITADKTDGITDNDIVSAVNRHLDRGRNKDCGTPGFYIQSDKTLSILDEKGNNLMQKN